MGNLGAWIAGLPLLAIERISRKVVTLVGFSDTRDSPTSDAKPPGSWASGVGQRERQASPQSGAAASPGWDGR